MTGCVTHYEMVQIHTQMTQVHKTSLTEKKFEGSVDQCDNFLDTWIVIKMFRIQMHVPICHLSVFRWFLLSLVYVQSNHRRFSEIFFNVYYLYFVF